jgi:BirA family biotin operon repressor/biotin-[acetyl-CoA-carboxylase] ligase
LIETIAATGSTNADLIARLQAGERLAEGYWLRAEQQTAGRGRSGRRWHSAPGNLYTSTVVQLRADDPPAPSLSLVTGVAVWEMLRGEIGDAVDLLLKWPNDIQVGRAKIAGILLERVGDAVVVGIGVNIRYAPEVEGRETTCIHDLAPDNSNGPEDALPALANTFAEALSHWRRDRLPAMLERWSARAHPIGSRLSVHVEQSGQVEGSFAGLDASGSLLLRLANGEVRTIYAGDVSLIAEGKS